MQCFLGPKSIAIVGASDRPFSWGYMITKNALESGFKGEVHLVNPHANMLFNRRAYSSIGKILGKIDLAVIVVPPQIVPQVIEECGSAGIKAAVVVTSGFSEAGREGALLENKLVEAARKENVRILGPNCNGVFNVSSSLNVSSISNMFLRDSGIAFLSQSGYLGHTLTVWGSRRNYHFGKFVATGNECDLSCVDFLEYLGEDTSVRAIMMYIEGLEDGRRFLDVAKKVSSKKPIIAIKAGRTREGSRAASSHTGALAGASVLYDTSFRQAGVIQVSSIEDMLRASAASVELPRLTGNRICILTLGGGCGVLLTDALASSGMEVPELSEDLKNELRRLIPQPRASVKNPIDLGAAWPLELNVVLGIIELILSQPDIDGLVIHDITDALKFPKYFEPDAKIGGELEFLEAMFRLVDRFGKPILAGSTMTGEENEFVSALQSKGHRVHNSINEIATILHASWEYLKHQELASTAHS